ncbi:MAG: flagellar motor protein MotD [Panacagrimonas sp.]
MAKKAKHEDHLNHEAWAIPYGDLVTLLLALFVVMYSMSAINEGKFRVASDSLNAAFGGKPRSPTPIQIGPSSAAPRSSGKPSFVPAPSPAPTPGVSIAPQRIRIGGPAVGKASGNDAQGQALRVRQQQQLEKIGDDVHAALGDLIGRKLVVVTRHESWLEVEIQTDILFASGAARVGQQASDVLDRLALALTPFDNRLRIEGHTDNIPIATREFPSNWELSSARAASVVHRFMGRGVDPRRMTVMGLAEYQPASDNSDAEGRNRNRRVVVVVLADPAAPLPQIQTVADAALSPPLAATEAAVRDDVGPTLAAAGRHGHAQP